MTCFYHFFLFGFMNIWLYLRFTQTKLFGVKLNGVQNNLSSFFWRRIIFHIFGGQNFVSVYRAICWIDNKQEHKRNKIKNQRKTQVYIITNIQDKKSQRINEEISISFKFIYLKLIHSLYGYLKYVYKPYIHCMVNHNKNLFFVWLIGWFVFKGEMLQKHW